MTVEQLLQQLKDIQAPPEPVWWLIAPAHGIAIGFVVVVVACTWLILRHRRANRLASLAELALADIRSCYGRDQDSQRLALELSKWLRQVSLLAFPERQVESLCGEGWLQFLDESLGADTFSSGRGRAFGNLVYARQAKLEAAQLISLCEQWLTAIKPRLRQRGRD
ncbi:MAG: DUF4381 domain-containing protein [Gammaproteobacteria bacterium]|nr:DUF4381 domain-containing protein [Gammaproteobacteria bacterium]